MRRREFIGLFCRAEIAHGDWVPLECCADPECKSPRRDTYQNQKCWLWAPLSADLYALGWREGENLQIEWRFADGDPASRQRLAAELVALRF
jgi:hypothetical protein